MTKNKKLESVIDECSEKNLIDFFRDRNNTFYELNQDLEISEKRRDFFGVSKQIGEYKLGDDKLILATIKVKTNLTERSGKKAQYEEAKKVIKNNFCNGGIFIFWDDSGNFRFSLIFADYQTTKQEWSNFKRFTFFVEKTATNTTFLKRIGNGDFSSLESIKEAFSVEKINEEFYTKIAEQFYRLTGGKFKAGAKTKDYNEGILRLPDSTDKLPQLKKEFGVRLIGRIIFCWFLKKKLTLKNQPLIGGEVLSSRSVAHKANYYHTVLSNLFFEVLNKPNQERNPNIKNNNDFKNIPFLNGGLFSPDENDFYSPNSNEVTIENEWFKDFFTILEEYNFTIDENSSKDAEIAIDPEILGRIFENLLAAINPETEESARKSTGSFYTPREIVDYMVDQSLLEHLKNQTSIDEEKLKNLFDDERSVDEIDDFTRDDLIEISDNLSNLKILDPACGSGAFPMGILHKILEITDKINRCQKRIIDHESVQKNENIYLEKEDKVIYKPENYNLEIICTYRGEYDFHLLIKEGSKEDDKGLFKVTLLTKFVKLFLNDWFKKKDKRTIANLFSQGYVEGQENNTTFNTLREKQILKKIIGKDDGKEFILWAYKDYNTEGKYRNRTEEILNEDDNESKNENIYLTERNSEKYFYELKEKIIRDVIHGVDIQPIAVEIAKLRFFLSLVIDEKVNDDKKNFGIEPLPNLEFNFVCANSLIGLDDIHYISKNNISVNNNIITYSREPVINELKKTIKKYYKSYGKEKENLKKKFKENRERLKEGYSSEVTDLLSQWDPFSHKKSDWFDPEFMFGVDEGFDVVIGNPPYFLYQGHRKSEIEEIKKIPIFKHAKGGKLNAYKLFLAKTTILLKKKGIMSMIFQNSFLADNSAKNIRDLYLNELTILIIDSFPERDDKKKRVFESVKMSVCILLAYNQQLTDYSFKLNVWNEKEMLKKWSVIFKKTVINEIFKKTKCIPYLSTREIDLFIKIQSIPKFFVNCLEGEINMTIHKNFLTKDSSNLPVIKGAGIQKYYITNLMSQGELEFLDSEAYHANNKGKKSNHHNQKRIILQGITGVNDAQRLVMTIIEKGSYLANSCNYIVSRDTTCLEYVLAVLNSKVANWYFKRTSTNSNVNCYEIESIPIPKISKEEQSPFNELVEQTLATKKENPKADTSELETKIDQLVYQLYHLTDEEIRVIEG